MLRIITDSAADYGLMNNTKELSIVPLTINIDDVEYKDCVTITPNEFYKAINKSKKFPRTSQPSPDAFYDKIKEAVDAGDDVLIITISSALSGTCGSANIAREMINSDAVTVYDSKQCTMGERILVDEALKLAKEGKTTSEIISKLDKIRENIVFIAYLDDLSYLFKGGRLSKKEKILGNLIRVKPLVKIGDDGKISIFNKSFGKARAFRFIKNNFSEEKIDKNYPLYTTFTDDNKNLIKLKSKIEEYLSGIDIIDGQFGPTIGTYVGKEGLGIFYVKQSKTHS